jgi:hypothetical protein
MKAFPALLALLAISFAPSSAQPSRSPWQREPEEIRRTLDSLASVSIGPYVHFVVGTCSGGRCEERVSLYRTDPDVPYTYRAAAWVGVPLKPQYYGVNRELPEEEAGSLLADARMGGIMALVQDSSGTDRRQPRFWLRARYGDRELRIDGASLGSPTYVASVEGGAGAVYDKVEKALLALLRRQHAERQ